MEQNRFDPVDITGIQNRLLLATGTSQELDEMLQSFMIEAVEQLRLDNFYVYLLKSDSAATGDCNDTRCFQYHLSYADGYNWLPHSHGSVGEALDTLCPGSDQRARIVAIDGLRYLLYSLENVGAVILEVGQDHLTVEIANALIPVMLLAQAAARRCITGISALAISTER